MENAYWLVVFYPGKSYSSDRLDWLIPKKKMINTNSSIKSCSTTGSIETTQHD